MSFLSYRSDSSQRRRPRTKITDSRWWLKGDLDNIVERLGDVTLKNENFPPILYGKKASSVENAAFLGLYGKKDPPVVYAVEKPSPTWDMRLVMKWPEDVQVLDERGETEKISFKVAMERNHDALIREVSDNVVWRLLNKDLVKQVHLFSGCDVDERQRSNKWIPVEAPSNDLNFLEWERSSDGVDISPLLISEEGNEQTLRLHAELTEKFENCYDRYHDVIDVEACSRRLGVSAQSLADEVIRTFSQCEVYPSSGCWVSPLRSVYRKVSIWKYGGLRPVQLFSHNGGDNLERHVVRHHPMRCELFLHGSTNHSRCCRPSHLCYGSCKANTRDMELRRAVATLITRISDRQEEGTWKDVRSLVDQLARLVNDQ